MKEEAAEILLSEINDVSFDMVTEVLELLTRLDRKKSREAAKHLLGTDNSSDVSRAAVDYYMPENTGEIYELMELFWEEGRQSVREKFLSTLVASGDEECMNKLFTYYGNRHKHQDMLMYLVEICGKQKVSESVPYLKAILIKKSLWNSKRQDNI